MEEVWVKDSYAISTDRAKLDLNTIVNFLSTSYWAVGRSKTTIQRSIEHSLVFGVYQAEEQIGFARVVTDYATFAWIADVFILPQFRQQGLAKWLIETILAHPDLQGLRRWVLATQDAHGLYEKMGFKHLTEPWRWMERMGVNTPTITGE